MGVRALWVLNELARIDRHRFLHVTAARSGSLRLDPARIRNVKVETLEVFDGVLFLEVEDSAKLARVIAHKANPQEKMHMHFTDAVEIAFDTPDDFPAVDGDPVALTLAKCLRGVRHAFRELHPHLSK